MKYLLSTVLLVFSLSLYSQDIEFYAETNKDTLLVGNVMQLKFTILNGAGDFQAPNFDRLDIVSGPNVASSFSFVNGQSSQEMSYTYIIMPSQVGRFTIPSASLVTEEGTLVTKELSFTVLDNPDGIIEQESGFTRRQPSFVPQEPIEREQVKPKRKLKRI